MTFRFTGKLLILTVLFVMFGSFLYAAPAADSLTTEDASGLPWWGWSIILFGFSFVLGIVAIVAGVGGGILYVPIVGALFPFHMDYVRGSGLLVALAGALSAAPRLLSSGMASLRLAVPMALVGSVGSLIGANVGLALPGQVVDISLGTVIILIVALMALSKRADHPVVPLPAPLSLRMGISGSYTDPAHGGLVKWNVHRLSAGLFTFFVIGFMAGMFGLGAGWANVPALNLLLGAPLKVSVATSILIIAINGSAASWVYMNQGAVLPVIALPSVVGMMLGTRLGARLLTRTKPMAIRWIVIGFLILAGLRSLLSGLGVIS
ncbi:MAG: sulfite exporter TauE/SafE family protein [Spirochaetaceae bacterium]|nr:sulfite exporter TauE/SafE family protein [Spirochaetaceae bacterium]